MEERRDWSHWGWFGLSSSDMRLEFKNMRISGMCNAEIYDEGKIKHGIGTNC